MKLVLWLFVLVHRPSTNMEEVEFMTYTAASQQGAIKTLWLNFKGAVIADIFTYSLWPEFNMCDNPKLYTSMH